MARHRRKHHQCSCRRCHLSRREVVLGWTERTTWPVGIVRRFVYIHNMTSYYSLMLFVIFIGLNLYSSSDLLNWDFEGQALSPVPDTLIGPGTVVERPKIIYSQETNLWNLWFHSDNSSYGLLRQGVATSPNITGEWLKILIAFYWDSNKLDAQVPTNFLTSLVPSVDPVKTSDYSRM